MDRVALPQGYEATTREATIYKPPGRPGTHVIDDRICETEPTMEQPTGIEPGTSGLVIQHPQHQV